MSQTAQTVTVFTKPSYPVQIGSQLLAHSGAALRTLLSPCHIAVVTDSTVAPLYLEQVTGSLAAAGFTVSTHIFPAGESSKNLVTLSELLESLASAHLTRSDCVVALGGGVTGDMAGLAAATYLRGLRFIQMPTTLLAAVDSSVGGKTAVNLNAGKNLVGAFWQPSAVLCDTACLQTLSPEILADGAAEAIKTGVLSDEGLFSLFETGHISKEPADIIAGCVRYKAGVVERDATEQGERKLLNLGHTVGHAIEKCSAYSISHGHAVAIGLAIISRAAERLGWTQEPISARIVNCLAANALPTKTGFTAEELTAAALSDKKRSGETITLVIPEKIGQCVLKKIPVTELLSVIAAGLEA